jgi:predicted oxidoreductase
VVTQEISPALDNGTKGCHQWRIPNNYKTARFPGDFFFLFRRMYGIMEKINERIDTMYHIEFGESGMEVPTVTIGCMRISNMNEKEAEAFVNTALEHGANFFDHADIYGGGASEEVFGKAVSPAMRDKVIIQTKCGIRPGQFDFSYEHIVNSVEGSLKRLGTDHVDALLLHRPDALMEPEEVARAFSYLKESGKVRHFGVSNHNPSQIQLLKKCVKQPIEANQLQFGLGHSSMIRSGMEVNTLFDGATDRDGGVLNYCRLNDITIQTWSPFLYGMFEGVFLGSEKFPALNAKLAELGAEYGVSPTTMASAWILRHPAKMQMIAGTMNPAHLKEICAAADVLLSRKHWYELYLSAGNVMP